MRIRANTDNEYEIQKGGLSEACGERSSAADFYVCEGRFLRHHELRGPRAEREVSGWIKRLELRRAAEVGSRYAPHSCLSCPCNQRFSGYRCARILHCADAHERMPSSIAPTPLALHTETFHGMTIDRQGQHRGGYGGRGGRGGGDNRARGHNNYNNYNASAGRHRGGGGRGGDRGRGMHQQNGGRGSNYRNNNNNAAERK